MLGVNIDQLVNPLLIYNRKNDVNNDIIQKKIEKYQKYTVKQMLNNKIFFINSGENDLSSTKFRNLFESNGDLTGVVDKEVEKFYKQQFKISLIEK